MSIMIQKWIYLSIMVLGYKPNKMDTKHIADPHFSIRRTYEAWSYGNVKTDEYDTSIKCCDMIKNFKNTHNFYDYLAYRIISKEVK